MTREKKHEETIIDDRTFTEMYLIYFPILSRFAQKILASEDEVENIVQDVFYKVWLLRRDITMRPGFRGYLYKSTQSRCVDHLRGKENSEKAKKIVREDFRAELDTKYESMERFAWEYDFEDDRLRNINFCMEALPAKCRQIFILRIIDEKSCKEIASELNISVKTVENQMNIARKKLRKQLS